MTAYDNDTYINFLGIIAWEPEIRELPSGDKIKTFTVGNFNEVKLKVTLWKELLHAPVEKGALVAIRGKYTVEQVDDNVYQNLSASSIAVVEPVERIESDAQAIAATADVI